MNSDFKKFQEKLVKEISDRVLLETKDVFYLDKEIFDKRIANITQKEKIPNSYVVQFKIAIPFNLRIKPDFLFHFPAKNGLCSYSVTKIGFIEAYFPLDVPNYFPYFHKEHTIIEMTFTCGDKITMDNYQGYFDTLIHTFNSFIEAYKMNTKEPGVNYVNNQSIHFLSFFRIIEAGSWKVEFVGPFYLNYNHPTPVEAMKTEELDEILITTGSILGDLHPFNLSEELLASSHHYIANGLYRESILYSQMSFESFIRTLYHRFLLIEGKSEQDILQIMDDTPFLSIIKKEISSRIGGSWDITKASTPVNIWYEKAYQIRNRIIHAGYKPKLKDAENALYAVEDMKIFIFKLLFAKKKIYKDIAQYFNEEFINGV